ncbi:MAG: hypothetical protein WD342_05065 [Verrucomicrobiales bacterium]
MKPAPVSPNVALVVLGALLLALFLGHLAGRCLHRFPERPEWAIEGGDAIRGRAVIDRYGCGACHVVPGIRSARGRVGPQLRDFRRQIYIAGSLPNMPENLVRWILDPQAIRPGTAMPTLGLSEQEARDAAAFIYENP